MIFILPFFRNEDNHEQVHQVIENLSAAYLAEYQDSMDLMAMGALAQGWANIGLRNESFLNVMGS